MVPVGSEAIDAGYFAKRVCPPPDWLVAPGVREVCSVSDCISPGAPDWIKAWRHNSLGWFNTARDAISVVPHGAVSDYRLFAYRIYLEGFSRDGVLALTLPVDVDPEPISGTFVSRGFDCVSRSSASAAAFECSPLSCNGMARVISVNEFCLIPTVTEAALTAAKFASEQPEPGQYFVIEVLERCQ